MARKLPAAGARKLKVFRTAIGFHDAYVAAPSRKAALAAWGSDADLFARGVAEEVTDPALIADALARPGEVVRRPRGTAADYFAALPETPSPRKAQPAAAPRKVKRRPPPSRAALDTAQAAMDAAEARFAKDDAALIRREQALATERRMMETQHREHMATLEHTRDDARTAYERALAETD